MSEPEKKAPELEDLTREEPHALNAEEAGKVQGGLKSSNTGDRLGSQTTGDKGTFSTTYDGL